MRMSEDLARAKIPLLELVPFFEPNNPAEGGFIFIDFETVGTGCYEVWLGNRSLTKHRSV
jgi:hypothetical protein